MRCWQQSGRDKAFLNGQRKGSTGACRAAAASKSPPGLEGLSVGLLGPQQRSHAGGGAGLDFEGQMDICPMG